MSYKRLIPCIFIDHGKAVKWFDDPTVISDDVVAFARKYCEHGADGLIIFDLSDSDEDHDLSIDIIKRINRVVSVPIIAGGNINRLEDVKKFLYAGAKYAMLNLNKQDSIALLEEAAMRFGKERIAVSLNDFDTLFKGQHEIEAYCSEIIFMDRPDLNSVANITNIPFIVVTDTKDRQKLSTF